MWTSRSARTAVFCGCLVACSSSTSSPGPSSDASNDVGGADGGTDAAAPAPAIVSSWVPHVAPGEDRTVATLTDVALTTDGAVLVVGRFKGTLDLGKGAHTAPDAEDDGFVARLKYPALEVQWTRHTNVAGGDGWESIAILPGGDAVVGGTVQPAGAARSLRVARLSASSGDVLWEKIVTPTGASSSMTNNSVVTTGGGLIVASGAIEGTATLDAVTLQSKAYRDLYAIALDGEGAAKWGYVDGVSSADYDAYLAVDGASGDLVMSGMQGSPDRRLYVARLNGEDGTKRWSRTIGAPGQAEGVRATTDATHLFVVGTAQGTVDFDPDTQTRTAGGLVASFVLADGAASPWAITRDLGTSTERRAFRDVVVHDGEVIACGGAQCVWLEPATGAVMSSWSPAGFSDESHFRRVVVDPAGRLLLAGGAYGTITIDGTKHEASTFAYRPFLLVLDP